MDLINKTIAFLGDSITEGWKIFDSCFGFVAMSGMQPNVEIQNKLYFGNGLHTDDEGHRRIAEKLKNFVEINI